MTIDARDVESVVLALGNGLAVLIPATAPVVYILKTALAALDAAGVIPQHTDALDVEAVRAQSAGIAAAQASALTSERAHKP